jgi:phosphoglycerol transferase MdoB-like AlkP superfamily enzyme
MTLNPTGRPNHWCTLAPRISLVLLLALAFVTLTGLLDGGLGVQPWRLLDQPRFPLANALPGLLIAGLLLVLTRRPLLSFGLTFLLQGLVYAVNVLKVANLGTPLLPADFRMVGQLRKGGMHVLSGYLPHSPWPYLMMLGGVLLLTAMWRHEKPLFPSRTRGGRLLTGAVLVTALFSMLFGASAWGKLYNGRVLWLEPWSAASTSSHSGLISSLLMFQMQFGHAKAKPDVTAATRLIGQTTPALRQYMQSVRGSDELPDIVVIQSESFFDPTIMRGYEASQFTPNLRRLAAHGISGELHVPTFGGGTIRTEFEVLTGLSLRYFDNLQFPYLQMNHKTVPSLVRTLNAHGYETVALHGNDPSFWNRTTAFKALGFDRFVSQNSFPANAAMDGKYMADSAMTDEIMTQLKDAGPPQFIFAISIEAHGPYDIQPGRIAERDAIPVPEGITGNARRELQTYLYHIGHADAELGRLVAWLAQRKRPSLVLFYGDHLPALSDSYAITGFVDGKGMLSQAGTWLLLDPRSTGTPQRLDTASWLLPGKLLEKAGIRDDSYFALTGLIGQPLAALSHAPGAPPLTENPEQLRVDKALASIDQLRLSGKLEPLLPKPLVAGSGMRATNAAMTSTPAAAGPR